MQKILFFLFIVFTSLCSSDEPIECQQNQQQELLSRYAGQYILKDFWDDLGKKRDWSAAKTKENDRISVYIGKHGAVGIGENWHEGQSYYCAFLKNNQLLLYGGHYGYVKFMIKDKLLWISDISHDQEEILKSDHPMRGPLV